MQPSAEENSLSAPHNPLESQADTLQAHEAGSGSVSGQPLPLASSGPPLIPPSNASENPPWSLAEAFGLGIFILVFANLVVALLAFVVQRLFAPSTPWFDMVRLPQVLVSAQVLSYCFILVLMYRMAGVGEKPALTAIGWNWPKAWPAFIGFGFVMALLIQGIGNFLPMPKKLPIDEFFRTPSEAWLTSIFAITLAPLLEELMFRGFLYPALARKCGAFVSVLITGLLFGAIHGMQLKFSWGPILLISLVGITLGVVRAFGKSVASTFLMHVGYNCTLMVAMFAGTDGFRHLDKLRQ